MERKLSKIYTSYNRLMVIILTLMVVIYNSHSCKAEETITAKINSTKVIDGDSIEINKHRIRLMGIDAPEYHQYCKDKNKKKYSCGIESKQYLINLLKDKEVVCKIHKKDQYDRDLCTCYADNVNINATMVKQGQALVYMESPYKAEQQEAKLNKRGIWQGKFMHPRLFRKLKETQKQN